MKRVYAIPKEIHHAFSNKLSEHHPKYEILFTIGLNTGLRVTDILNLQAGNFHSSSFKVIEKKTGKSRLLCFDEKTMERIRAHIKQYRLSDTDYIVFRRANALNYPLSRVQAYKIIKRVAKALKMNNIGPHSLRKTFAIAYFKTTKDIELVKKALNHKYTSTTLLYILDDLNSLSEFI